jgi:hypothetical protein
MLLRFQKAVVRGNYETGNQAFSMRLRFLTIRDPVLGRQIFVSQQEFLIDCPGDIGEQARPKHSRASLILILEPGVYMLLRFQKPAVRENCETGNQAFSMRLRFLTMRALETIGHLVVPQTLLMAPETSRINR